MVRWLPSPSKSPKRQLGLHRGVPQTSPRLHRRTPIRDLSLLDRLDSLAEHPLGRPLPLRHPVRNGLPADLHGYVELPDRRIRDSLCQRTVRRKLHTKYIRSCAPARG